MEGDRRGLPELFRGSGEIDALSKPSLEKAEDTRMYSPTEAFGGMLQGAVARDPAAYDLRPAAVAKTGVRILRLLVASAGGNDQSAGETVARVLQRYWVLHDERAADLLNQALILCADHELNVSSFTARCVASAGATPYAAVVAGLAALGGVKHGGNTERVAAFLVEAEVLGDPRGVVASRLRRGESVPGFGHQLYPEGDPRGAALLAALAANYPDSEALELGEEVANTVGDLMDEQPNVDFALAILVRVLSLPPSAALALFSLGRTVGWVGHAIEQYEMDRIIRPRARYTGESPKPSQ